MPGEHRDFSGQRDDEEFLFVFRRHIIAMRKGFYCFLGPFAVSSIPPLFFSQYMWVFWFPVVGFVVGFVLFSYFYIMWYYTYFIVSSQRIRQVTQKGFFGKHVIDLRLAKVQNISYDIPGFSGELFKFGTIVMQTMVGDLIIKNVEHPEIIYNKLQNAIIDAMEKEQATHNETTIEEN